MPLPTFNRLGPDPSFNDLVNKVNTLVSEMTNLMLNLDSLNVVSLTADHIDAGTIDAGIVTIRSDLMAGAYVKIDGNGMIINNGTIDTFKADINGNVTATNMTIRNDLMGAAFVQISSAGLVINNGIVDTFKADVNGAVTMTSALIQSAAAYPKVVMDPASEFFGAYTTASKYIKIFANDAGDPLLYFENTSNTVRTALIGDTFGIGTFGKANFTATDDTTIQSTGGHVHLVPRAGNKVFVPSWGGVYSAFDEKTLQEALNDKADISAGVTGTVYVASSSGGSNDKSITFVRGIRTS